MGAETLTRERFVQRYARYFGSQRVEAIRKLGYLLIEARGEGPYLWDTEGKRYLDLWNVGGGGIRRCRGPRLDHQRAHRSRRSRAGAD
jgi:glutamate-1-semialdehyde aminotransferase